MRVVLAVLSVIGVVLAWGAAVSRAADYQDIHGNVCEGPNCFNAQLAGGGAAHNAAFGPAMMTKLTSGSSNVAFGRGALGADTSGYENVASGLSALGSNTTGGDNVASGLLAMFLNTSGSANVASGVHALSSNTTGSLNVALGAGAGQNLTKGSNNLDISNAGMTADSGKIRIGTAGIQTTAFLAGVSGVSIPGPTKTVVVNSSGQLGTAPAGPATAPRAASASGSDSALARKVRRQAAQLRSLTAQLQAQGAQLRALIVLMHGHH